MKYKHLKLPLCFAILCISSNLVAEVEIYKETSPSGTVIFTDKPKSATAEKINVEDINTMPAPPTGRGQSESISKQGDDGEETQESNLEALYQASITFPPENHVAYAGGQDFFVKATTQPELGSDYTIRLEHNGQTLEGFKIAKISPGSHTVRALITDSDGTIVTKSQSIKFLVKIRRRNKPRYQPQP